MAVIESVAIGQADHRTVHPNCWKGTRSGRCATQNPQPVLWPTGTHLKKCGPCAIEAIINMFVTSIKHQPNLIIMNKFLSIGALALVFAVSGCSECKDCHCTMTRVDSYTPTGGTTTTETSTDAFTETVCNGDDSQGDLRYWESNPVEITESTTSNGYSRSETTYECSCE